MIMLGIIQQVFKTLFLYIQNILAYSMFVIQKELFFIHAMVHDELLHITYFLSNSFEKVSKDSMGNIVIGELIISIDGNF